MSDFTYFNNQKFTDIWEDVTTFKTDYHAVGIPCLIDDTSVQTLYYLLYARYGNSTIASSDVTQFKYKVFAIIFQYGATWEKRLEIQATLRGLTESDIMSGGKQIMNTAENPATTPTTNTLTELEYIDRQNTVNYKKSKLEAYSTLMLLLEKDVTEELLNKFKKLFLTVVAPQKPSWYVTETEE